MFTGGSHVFTWHMNTNAEEKVNCVHPLNASQISSVFNHLFLLILWLFWHNLVFITDSEINKSRVKVHNINHDFQK